MSINIIIIIVCVAIIASCILLNNKKKFNKKDLNSLTVYDPENYKWGVFYYNRKDSRLLPFKRNSMGFMVNFANPYSKLTILSIFIIFLVLLDLKFGHR